MRTKRDNVLYILNLLYDEGHEAEYCSPEFVNSYALDNGVELDSGEVVMISNYYGESHCPTGRCHELEMFDETN